MMTSRERILAAIKLQEPDRVPVSPFVSSRMIKNMSKKEWEQLLHLTDVFLSFGLGGDIYLGQEAEDGEKRYQEGNITVREIYTARGILTERVKEDRDSLWLVEPFFKNQEDVEKFLAVPYKTPQINADNYFYWQEKMGDEGLVWVFVPSAIRLPFSYFGPEQFYLKIAEDLDLVEELTRIAAERIKEYIEECCRKGVRYFRMGGSEHCGPAVVNPKIFQRLVVSYDGQLVDLVHEYKGFILYHIHNKVREILDEIVEIGGDLVSPLEAPPGGDITLREVKEKIGDKVCLMGNLDDLEVIARASQKEIRERAIRCIKDAAKGGGYILSGTEAGIYRPRWVENFLVMARIGKDHLYQR